MAFLLPYIASFCFEAICFLVSWFPHRSYLCVPDHHPPPHPLHLSFDLAQDELRTGHSLYRLTEADYSTGELYQYGYDPVGNRLQVTDHALRTKSMMPVVAEPQTNHAAIFSLTPRRKNARR
jgi:hypothetical protein